ncbi:MAG: pyridoxamine 5'-phosphate oxidase family protein [Patescibacteria group bacterium]
MSLRNEILKFLQTNDNLTLATCSSAKPWSSVVIYVNDDKFNFYFTSDPTSRHAREISKNPHVSFAINHERIEEGYIKAMQVEGFAEKLNLKEVPFVFKLYLKKFPFAKSFLPSFKRLLKKGFRWKFYKIRPARIFYMNKELYDKGVREEFELGNSVCNGSNTEV